MTEELTAEHERQLLHDLHCLIAERVQAEQAVASDHTGQLEHEDASFAETLQELTDRYGREKSDLEKEYSDALADARSRFDVDYGATQGQYEQTLRSGNERFERDSLAAESERDDAQWMVNSCFDDSSDDSPKHQFESFKMQIVAVKERVEADWGELEQTATKAAELLRRRRMGTESASPEPSEPIADRETAHDRFEECAAAAGQQFQRLRRQKLARIFVGGWLFLAFLVLWGAAYAPVYFLLDPARLGILAQASDPDWIAMSAGAVLGLCTLIFLALFFTARWKAAPFYAAFQQHLEDARRAQRSWHKAAKAELDQRHKEYHRWYAVIVEQRDKGLKKADDTYARKAAEIVQRKETELTQANAKYPALLTQIAERRDAQLEQAGTVYPRRLEQLESRFVFDTDKLKEEHATHRAAIEEGHQRARNTMTEGWSSGFARVLGTADRLNGRRDELFPPWVKLAAAPLQLPVSVPPAIPIGSHPVDLEHIRNGMPQDVQLVPETTRFSLPALLPFPDNPSLLLKCNGPGRGVAVQTMQAVMLRLLTALPAGKVRFTILDPVGLGENFSAFMHLADYDELMISNRIWTEAGHIEKRLANLTEHMEDVFQTYLRNEFRTIEEYNQHAGEVAEPYHILVAANFPANFTENAARRLVSIVSSGPRCGVFTLMSVDTNQQMPHNFQLADIEQDTTKLMWKEDRFVSADPDFAKLPLVLDDPPAVEEFGTLVKAAGHESKDARRVEVSFDRIAPPDDKLWSSDSRAGVDVPLGRAGATKLQHLRLGKGTSQHVMVAGKTGSGKSSFLHALITNTALYYGPDQIEFYLIDFKKGVEFKTYATHGLPHARVIAIESDREFGLSTLQRADSILKTRGDLFREHNVQDLPGYRQAQPNVNLPRILLIIDEFQEFFVEDDKIGQNASLLLDRLVRQGRAFGIHVLLGSQTLGGAYSLARSTMGQVAVRVALQCSENDAHLILSEENTAARLLTRPGEAIYNDANGLLEGNHPFQIAWLPDDHRERLIEKMREEGRRRGLAVVEPIVFEGNVPADPRRNPFLTKALESAEHVQPAFGARTWLGEAVAIKDPTSVVFRRQSGVNVLVAGQHAASALGIMSTCVVGLAAQHPATATEDGSPAARFCFLDGTNQEEPEADVWRQLADAIPHETTVVGPRDVKATIVQIAEEVTRRIEESDDASGPLYLVIYNLSRFRDLRREEDDYGFGGFDKDKPASTGKQFGDILREGPGVGIHTIIWCDTYNNMNRWLSRDALRELEMRVVFQMSAADSSNLIDSPAAGRLGTNRALLHLETHGSLEKFRPYAMPSEEWIETVRRSFCADAPEPPQDSNVSKDDDVLTADDTAEGGVSAQASSLGEDGAPSALTEDTMPAPDLTPSAVRADDVASLLDSASAVERNAVEGNGSVVHEETAPVSEDSTSASEQSGSDVPEDSVPPADTETDDDDLEDWDDISELTIM